MNDILNKHGRQAFNILLTILVVPLAGLVTKVASVPGWQTLAWVTPVLAIAISFGVYRLQQRGERRMDLSAASTQQSELATSASAFSAVLQDQVKALTKQMEELRTELTEAQAQIKTLQSDLGIRTGRIEELERALKTKTDELQSMREQNAILEKRFNAMSAENVELRAKIHQLENNMHEPAPGTTTTTTVSVAATKAPVAVQVPVKSPSIAHPAKAPPPAVKRRRRR
jgi:cell division protein FtsB